MIQLLKERERQLVKERDELLLAVDLKYMHYIHALLQQKLIITEKIRCQYDHWINDNNDMIYNSINDQFKTMLNTQDIIVSDINQTDNKTDNQTKIEAKNDNEIDNKLNILNNNTNNNINHNQEFVPNMSTEAATKLSINDKIDHRDLVGCFTSAIIVDKKDTNLKIRYIGWNEEWDVWSDPINELYKFASYQSISRRPRHRLYNLKTNDLIDINPISHHKGWKIGEIIEMDNDSGQVKVSYKLTNNDGYIHFYWVHIDNKNEIEPLHTYTDFDDLTDKKKTINITHTKYNCLFCELSFCTYNILRKHIQNDHSNTRQYICKYCPQAFIHKQGRTIHESQHLNNEQHKCELCPKLYKCNASFKLINHLTWHYQRVHKKYKKQNNINNNKSVSNSRQTGRKRKKHSKSAIVSKRPKRKKQKLNSKSNDCCDVNSFENSWYISIKCHICDKHFDNLEKYIEHLKKDYENDPTRIWRYCDLGCKINKSHPLKTAKYTGIYPSTSNFLQHITWHTDERAFKCKINGCNKASSTKKLHEKHWIKYHKKNKKNKNKKNKKKEYEILDYECAKGMSVTQLREEMKKRGLNHTGQKKTLLNRILSMGNSTEKSDKKVDEKIDVVKIEQGIPVIPSDMPVVSTITVVESEVNTVQNDNQQNVLTNIQTSNECGTNILCTLPSLE